MNQTQRWIAIFGIAVMMAMVVVPPFRVVDNFVPSAFSPTGERTEIRTEYHLAWRPGTKFHVQYYIVDYPRLLFQLSLVTGFTLILLLSAGLSKRSGPKVPGDRVGLGLPVHR